MLFHGFNIHHNTVSSCEFLTLVPLMVLKVHCVKHRLICATAALQECQSVTVDETWGLAAPAMATSSDKIKDDMKLLMVEMVKKFGGPEHYLRTRYGTRAAKQEWLNYLAEIQPCRGIPDPNLYSTTVDLPVAELKSLSQAIA